MSLKGLARFLLAYVAASFSVLVLSAVLVEFLHAWFVGVRFWPVVSACWLVAVGVPATGWASQRLSKTLGVKPVPMLGVGSWRSVPVFGGPGAVLADVVGSVVPGRRQIGQIDVPDRWAFLCGSYVFPEDQVKELLQKAWSRQRRGRSAFARSYWLERAPFWGDRDHYEAWCSVAEAGGLLVNRKPRHSGKLIVPPILALSALRNRVRRVKIN